MTNRRHLFDWATVATAIALLLGAEVSGTTVRLLTVGNSFAENALTYLPELATAAGHKLIVGRANLGGCTLERHWRHTSEHEADAAGRDGKPYSGAKLSLADLLRRERWDFITLQQVSYKSHDPATYQPFLKHLHGYISERAPQAKLLLHQIWAYRVDDPRFVPENAGREPHTQNEMYTQVRRTYHAFAKQYGLGIIPSGDAMYLADTNERWGFRPEADFDPDLLKFPARPEQRHSLHVGWYWRKQSDGRRVLKMDGHHASNAGKYLIGCVWFETCFGESVVPNAFVPPDLDPDYAAFLRTVAHQAVERLSEEGAAASEWAQAAGPQGNFRSAPNATTSWSVALDRNVAWKLTLPETGQNTPVISQGRVFFSTMSPLSTNATLGRDIVAWCCDAGTGRVLWKRTITGKHSLRLSGCFGDSTSPPATCDGERVVFVNASGGVECFDYDGRPLWRREILSVSRTLPFHHDGRLVFTRQIYPPDPDGNFPHKYKDSPLEMWTQLHAIDMRTGEDVWTSRCGVNMGNAVLPQRLNDGRLVAVVGRGGGHGPPEKPDGISLVDLKNGATIWTLPLERFMSTMSYRIRDDVAHIFHGGEHLSVSALTGEILRRISILKEVPVRRYREGHYVTERETIPDAGKGRMITQTSNLLVEQYHYFRSYTRPYLGRVNVDSGRVEYLELPLQVAREHGQEERRQWFVEPASKKDVQMKDQAIRKNDMLNSRGLEVMGDKRSRGNGWGHVAAPTPSVAGARLYVPVQNGTVYVIRWDTETLDERALLAVNDLGPAGSAYTRASVSFAEGRVYARTIRELICIAE